MRIRLVTKWLISHVFYSYLHFQNIEQLLNIKLITDKRKTPAQKQVLRGWGYACIDETTKISNMVNSDHPKYRTVIDDITSITPNGN